jgi:hypothetical protein
MQMSTICGQVRATLGYLVEPLVGERIAMAGLVGNSTAWIVPPSGSPVPIPIDSRPTCCSEPVTQLNAYEATSLRGPIHAPRGA